MKRMKGVNQMYFKIIVFVFIVTAIFSCGNLTAEENGEVVWQEDGIPAYYPDDGKIEKMPVVVSDGSGGTILAWIGWNPLNREIHAQRLDKTGNNLWGEYGKKIVEDTKYKTGLKIVSDGSGGAIIAWMYDPYEGLFAFSDIYIQRIDSNGESVWEYGGILVCDDPFTQILTDMIPDGSGGAILVWEDKKNLEMSGVDIYAQRIDKDGNLMWTIDGVPVCTAPHLQERPCLVPDNDGGAVITWQDARSDDYDLDIYAQRVDKDGDLKWIDDGIVICSAGFWQSEPCIVNSNNGFYTIVWKDGRNSLYYDSGEIYAQRISDLGDIKWQADGIVVCDAPGEQKLPKAVSTSTGGTIIVWEKGNSIDKIKAQTVNIDGTIAWDPNGVTICDVNGEKHIRGLVRDNFNGAVVVWTDYREEDADIFVQNISATGNVLWKENGLPVNDLWNDQKDACIAKDKEAGVVVAWTDKRYDEGDIYAQRIGIGKVSQWDDFINSLFFNYLYLRQINKDLYCIRDELLYKFPEGKLLADMTYKHVFEIGRIILRDDNLKKRSSLALCKLNDNLINYLDGRYRSDFVLIDDYFARELLSITYSLCSVGSRELNSDLRYVQEIINEICDKSIKELEERFLKQSAKR
ncbi:hypothetical protein ACFL1F_00155 [Chlamydiota bacterium]